MDDQAMARLAGEIEHAKRLYRDLRDRLSAHLQPYTTDTKAPEHLLAHALESGFDHTLEVMNREPAKFALVFPTSASVAASRPRTEELLDRLMEAEQTLTGLVVQREDALARQQPGRARVMVHEGREFTFDATTGEWRYLDTPGAVYRFPATRVENTAAPTPENMPDKARSPGRRHRPRHEP
jgi:hypothetical protein